MCVCLSVYACRCVCVRREKRRNLKDGTLYNRFLLVLSFALANENEEHAQSNKTGRANEEKCYAETLLANIIIIIILNRQTAVMYR